MKKLHSASPQQIAHEKKLSALSQIPLASSQPNEKTTANKRQSVGMSFGGSDDEEEAEVEEDSDSEEGLGVFETCVEFDLDEVLHFTHDEDKPDRPEIVKHRTK